MASVPANNALTFESSPLAGILQLAWQLNQASKLSNAADNSAGIAADANANYMNRYNATESVADTYAKLIAALQPTVQNGMDETDLVNRTNQIFSSLVPTVDRASAITASQGYARALQRGMGNSTQAENAADDMTRRFGDVYQKLMETSRQRAFDELKAKLAGNTQALQAATQGFAATNPMQIAQQYAAAAGKAATESQKSYQDNFSRILSSDLAQGAMKAVAKDGFSNLLGALKTGINDIWNGNGNSSSSSAQQSPSEVPEQSYNPYDGFSGSSFNGYTTGSEDNYYVPETSSWGGENFSAQDRSSDLSGWSFNNGDPDIWAEL